MAIPDFPTWNNRLSQPFQTVGANGSGVTPNRGGIPFFDCFPQAGGSTPSTAVVPTNATVGSLGTASGTTALFQNSTGVQRLLRFIGSTLTSSGMALLCDRLSHQGGLSGTTTGAQTTNLPTAALTRYTSGVGVWAGLNIYTTIGATAGTTATLSYTNSAGTPGQASPVVAFGSNNGSAGNSIMVPIPLASGDVGVQAVASVTLNQSSGTAGNFGVTLFKPLCWISLLQIAHDADAFLGLMQPIQIQTNACLFMLGAVNSNSNWTMSGSFQFCEE